MLCILFQESPDEVPDVVQTHVLLQTCREAAVQRLDQQQRFKAVLPTFSQMVSRFGILGEFVKTLNQPDQSSRTAYAQVCCCVRPPTAHAQLCAEYPVLHDV